MEIEKPKRLVFLHFIPEFNIFFKCYIQTLYFSVTERTGDIDVEITLVEIKKNKTLSDVARGLLER